MKPKDAYCPSCGRTMPPDDFTAPGRLSRCPSCGKQFAFKEAAPAFLDRKPAIDPDHPPAGVWYSRSAGGLVLGASTRNLVMAAVFAVFAAYSGIMAYGLARYAPAESSQTKFVLSIAVTMTTLLACLAMLLLFLVGKTEMRVEGGSGSLFSGVGGIGRSRRFSWDRAEDVLERDGCRYEVFFFGLRCPIKQGPGLFLLCDRPIPFGTTLNSRRRNAFLQMLRQELKLRGTAKPSKTFDDSFAPEPRPFA